MISCILYGRVRALRLLTLPRQLQQELANLRLRLVNVMAFVEFRTL